MSRTHRRAYTKSKAFDASCRCHGGCPWCEQGRAHAAKRQAAPDDIEQQLDDEYVITFD